MEMRIKQAGALRGTVTVPGDKSISHRAVMFGALADGDTHIDNFLMGEDCLATVRCFRALGVECSEPVDGKLTVHGRGLYGLKEPEDILNAANSGTTMRLLLGILAGQSFFSILTGDKSLRRRPMGRVTGPLGRMGAQIFGRKEGGLAPLAIKGGNLKGISFNSPVASAQVKSAVLLAGLFAEGETTVTEPSRSRDHTERMLQHFGVKINIDDTSINLSGHQRLKGCKVVVPGDISSAAFLLVAGAIVPKSDLVVSNVGINPTRDGIIEVLKGMGADLAIVNEREVSGEPVADLHIKHSKLQGVTIGGDLIPRLIDEIPVLAVAAAFARGETIVKDAGELKVKESNRIATVVKELQGFGVDIEERPDGFAVKGGGPLKGTVCDSHGDHRIAMAAAVAGLAADGETVIRGAECTAISFPHFSNVLNSLWEE